MSLYAVNSYNSLAAIYRYGCYIHADNVSQWFLQGPQWIAPASHQSRWYWLDVIYIRSKHIWCFSTQQQVVGFHIIHAYVINIKLIITIETFGELKTSTKTVYFSGRLHSACPRGRNGENSFKNFRICMIQI